MHPYSINYSKKGRVPSIIVLVLLTIITNNVVQSCGLFVNFQQFIQNVEWLKLLESWEFFSISPPLLFSIFYYNLFNKWIWKVTIIKPFVGLPDISGTYKGILISSYCDEEGNPRKIPMILTVTQTFSNISFRSTFTDTKSGSESIMGALLRYENNEAIFAFSYGNNSEKVDLEVTNHCGMNELRFNLLNGKVNGKYFTDRGTSQTKGTMELSKCTL